MSVVLNDLLRTTVNFTLADGTLYQNVYTHIRTGVAIYSDAEHIAFIKTWCEDMYNEIAPQVQQNVTEALSYVDKIGWSGTEWEVTENIGVFTPTFNPGNTNDAMPNQVSPYVLFKTARPKSVGRKFLFPMTEGSFVGSYLSTPLVTALVAYAADAVNAIPIITSNTLEPGIVRTSYNEFLPFTVAVVTNVCGSQRRRRPGVGA